MVNRDGFCDVVVMMVCRQPKFKKEAKILKNFNRSEVEQ
jgi:hypothetical protein